MTNEDAPDLGRIAIPAKQWQEAIREARAERFDAADEIRHELMDARLGYLTAYTHVSNDPEERGNLALFLQENWSCQGFLASELQAIGAERQAAATASTWALVIATIGLVLATVVLIYVTMSGK